MIRSIFVSIISGVLAVAFATFLYNIMGRLIALWNKRKGGPDV